MNIDLILWAQACKIYGFKEPIDPPTLPTQRREIIQRIYGSLHAHRESVANLMLQHGIPTGHGDTFDDLLAELDQYLTEYKTPRRRSPPSE